MANKSDLIEKVKKEVGLNESDAQAAVNTVFKSIEDYLLTREKVTVQGFGTFNVADRKSRKGRNPSTGEDIQIEGKAVPTFGYGKTIKDNIKDNVVEAGE